MIVQEQVVGPSPVQVPTVLVMENQSFPPKDTPVTSGVLRVSPQISLPPGGPITTGPRALPTKPLEDPSAAPDS